MEEEEALLYTLQRLRGGPLHPGALSNEELVLTGSGFSGGTRLAVRELAALAGLEYSGDLVRGRTTHLVLLRSSQTTPAESAMAIAAAPPPAGTASVKRECALRWGIPCVRLAWLLDSCETGRALPVHPYLASTNNKQQVAEAANAQKQQAVAPPHSCQQLARRARPSSTASNTPSAAPARNLQLAAGGSGRDSSVQQRQQQPQVEQHPMTSRAVPAPVANMLADELRRMSISPEPQEALAAAAGSCQHHQQQRQQRLPPQSTDNLPLQRSPSPPGSPQHSLSLQGLVEPAGDGSQAGSPGAAAAASSMHASAASTPQHRPSCLLAAGHAACPTADGSMQQSPAQDALSFRFCLGRSRSTQDLPGGSPMAESPAVGTLFSRSSEGSQGTEPSMQQQLSQPAGTPATEGSPQVMGTLPTPACVRQWSDDDSLTASPLPVGACDRGPSTAGVTQTPPHVRRAQAAAAALTQGQPASQQPQQALQQQKRKEPQPAQARIAQEVAEPMEQGMPTAGVQRWADDDTVASEGPSDPADLVVSDSESDCEDLPGVRILDRGGAQQHQQRRQHHTAEAPAPTCDRQASAGPAVPLLRQASQQAIVRRMAPPPKQARGLLQVSRPSAAAQPLPCTPSRAPSGANSSRPAPPSPASPGDEPMPSPCVALETEPALLMGCSEVGSRGLLPGGSLAGVPPQHALPRPEQRERQRQQSGSSSAGPATDGHHGTMGRRSGGTAAATGDAVAAGEAEQCQPRRDVRDWSEDGSSGEDLPTPSGTAPLDPERVPGGQRRQRRGLTGLTQLDPASIVVARPKPSVSAATWRSSDDASSGGARGMKLLQRPPRGNAVRAHHGLSSLRGVQFAEQVQVASASGLVLSTKDKKTAVRLQPGGLTEEEAEEDDFLPGSGGRDSLGSCGGRRVSTGQREAQRAQQAAEPVLAEPQAFYRLPDGTWWLEHCRFFTAAQAQAAAAAAGRTLTLPPGFDHGCELLKAVQRQCAPMEDVAGAMQVRRVKQGGNALRLRGGTASAGRSYFWRLALDTTGWRVVTDQPTADFVSVN